MFVRVADVIAHDRIALSVGSIDLLTVYLVICERI